MMGDDEAGLTDYTGPLGNNLSNTERNEEQKKQNEMSEKNWQH
jgi:hypothetical protein